MLKPVIEDCRKFRLLSSFEQSIVLEALVGLAGTWIGLRLAGFQRWKNMLGWLTRVEMRSAGGVASASTADKIARLEEAAARHFPFSTNCLEQSLVLLWLLRKRGFAAELRIGVRKDSNRFEAHAWVEFEGAVLNGASEEHLHFVPFKRSVTSLETQTH